MRALRVPTTLVESDVHLMNVYSFPYDCVRVPTMASLIVIVSVMMTVMIVMVSVRINAMTTDMAMTLN